MKIKNNLHNKKYSLLSSNLINILSYKEILNKKITLNSLKTIELRLKQILKIIFVFNKVKKKIVFVGFPKYNTYDFLSLFNKLDHNYLNNKSWINGLLTNSNSISYYLKSKKVFKLLKKQNILFLQKLNNLEHKPDLIVLYNETKNIELIKEAIKLKIPIISFLNEGETKNSHFIYNVFYCKIILHKEYLTKLFYFLLSSILLRNLKLTNRIIK